MAANRTGRRVGKSGMTFCQGVIVGTETVTGGTASQASRPAGDKVTVTSPGVVEMAVVPD